MLPRELESKILQILDGPEEHWDRELGELLHSHPDLAQAIRERARAIKRQLGTEPPATTPAAPADPTLEHPLQVGPYRILAVLGEGGMGTVYRAVQRQPVRRDVALKLIKRGMDSKAVLARFEAERRALALMEHTSIAKVLDGGISEDGQPYFVMEYVKGIPISDYCDRNKLTLRERIGLFQQVCAGVQHAHLKGVMHRDLKPSNVLVTVQDSRPMPKIIDFGLAKATNHHLVEQTIFTEQGVLIGTPEYMSPEQAGLDGLDVDTRTDVYSLGVLLYELLVGELPFPRDQLRKAGLAEMQRVIREEEPPKPSTRITTLVNSGSRCAAARRLKSSELQRSLRGDLDWIAIKALEKDRTRRYETAQELSADLQRHLDFEPVVARPPSVGYRLNRFVRRYRVQCVAAAIVVAASSVGGASAVWGFVKANERAEEIELLLSEAKKENARNRVFADVAQLQAARILADTLFPAWPDRIPEMEAWLREYGRPLAARLPELEVELATVRSRAKPATDEDRNAARESHPRWPELIRLQYERDKRGSMLAGVARRQIALLETEIEASAFEFDEGADANVHRTLTGLVKELRAFVDADAYVNEFGRPARSLAPHQLGDFKSVTTGLSMAQRVQREEAASDAAWSEAIAAIGESDGVSASTSYGGLRLTRQVELAPIGMDPDSKLWEFVHLPSGERGREAPARDPTTGRLALGIDSGIVFVLSPAGYLPVEAGQIADHRHSVRLDAFFVSKYEMTFGQWLRLHGGTAFVISDGGEYLLPVDNVDWFRAEQVLRRRGLELPSELRWEYACRAGTTSVWWTGSDEEDIRQHENLNNSRPLPVGYRSPNPFGLYDMAGNVREWCMDEWTDYGTEREGDGLRPYTADGSFWRSCRGGNYSSVWSDRTPTGARHGCSPAFRMGLRAARSVLN